MRRTYRTASPGTRLHVLGRFLTCPYLRVLDYLPPQARVLDLGSGHGIFAHLAAAAGARLAVALEPDTRKVFLNYPAGSMRVVNGYREAVRGRFDAVSMFDVLYRFPLAEWDELFSQVRACLDPGGVFLLKEMDPERPGKSAWNRAQETLAGWLRLGLGDRFSYESTAAVARRLRSAGFADVEVIHIDRGFPHAHVLYVARSAGDARTAS